LENKLTDLAGGVDLLALNRTVASTWPLSAERLLLRRGRATMQPIAAVKNITRVEVSAPPPSIIDVGDAEVFTLGR